MPRYVDWDEQLRRRAATQKRHADVRAKSHKLTELMGRSLRNRVRGLIKDCGLTQSQISDFSGIIPACVSRFMRRYNPRARFDTIVGLAHAAGYEIKFEPIDPHKDLFRDLRRLKPKPLPKGEKG